MDEKLIEIQCTTQELSLFGYDCAYLVKAALDGTPEGMNSDRLARTIATSIVTAAHARDRTSTKHELCRDAVDAARKLHRAQAKTDA